MKLIPPESHLYWTLWSETCYEHDRWEYVRVDSVIWLTLAIFLLTLSVPACPDWISFKAESLGTINAKGSSPLKSSGTPRTHVSLTSGCESRCASNSAGATWKPRTLRISYDYSSETRALHTYTRPMLTLSLSTTNTSSFVIMTSSPVRSQPSTNVSAVLASVMFINDKATTQTKRNVRLRVI